MDSRPPDRPAGEAEVRLQLERLFASESFRASKRCQAFLEFVVSQTLAGRAAELREKVIGVEVFQRRPGYDSNDDPVVRATAGDVRKRLAQYYQDPARGGELRIELLPGSYAPEFRMPAVAAPAEVVTLAAPEATKEPRTFSRRALLYPAGAALLGAAWWVSRPAHPVTRFERYWAPLVSANGNALICVGQAKLYNFPRSQQAAAERALNPQRAPGASTPADAALLQSIRPVWDRYVPLGDAEALSRIAILMDRRGKAYRIRGSAQTSLADLREGAAVLIGAFSNDWTLRVSRDLRYRLARTEDFRLYVEDTGEPASRKWLGPAENITTGNAEGADFTDYAIISRVFEPTTGNPMVSMGGITHLATSAAGEFLTTPAMLEAALEGAPAGWERKNLQMVIEAKVIGHSATPPRLLALHVW